jgi:multiple sugar transport system substrate-binding protein
MKLIKSDFLRGICVAALVVALLVGFGNAPVGAEPVKITFRYFPWPVYVKSTEKLIEAFNAKYMPDIELVYGGFAGTTDEERAKMMHMFRAEGSEYDIILADSPWVSEFAAAGWLLPIDQYLDDPEEFRSQFFPFSNAIASYAGKQYGINKSTDISLLYYRTDVLSNAGLKYPRTIDQLVDVAQKAQSLPEVSGFIFQGAQYEGLICTWIEFLHNYGGTIFGESKEDPAGGEIGQRKSQLDSEAAIKATQLVYDLIYKYKISPFGTTTYTETETRKTFMAGGAAMMREWHDIGVMLEDPETSYVIGKWDATQIPAGPAGSHTCIGGWVWAINKFTKHPKEACIALKFMTDLEQQKMMLFTEGSPPSRAAVYNYPEISEDPVWGYLAPVLMQAAQSGIPRPLSPIWPEQSDVITRAIHKVFINEMTAKEAMEWANQEVQGVEDAYVPK